MNTQAQPGEFYQHVKTGGVYELLHCAALLEWDADAPDHVVYRSTETGAVWIRPAAEFFDGRFFRCATPAAPEAAAQAQPSAEAWALVSPQGERMAVERHQSMAWARLTGTYKTTLEGVLGYEEKGWRTLPTAEAAPAQAEMAAFEQFCREECSPGAAGAEWYRHIWRRACAYQRAALIPPAAPAEPYGHVTTHSVTGQQFFYRHPEPPYLDNASECVAVYAAPSTAPAAAPAAAWTITYKDGRTWTGDRLVPTAARAHREAAPDARVLARNLLAAIADELDSQEAAPPTAIAEQQAGESRWVCLDGMNADEFAAYEYGCALTMGAVARVLDGLDTGEGVANAPWEPLRRRLLALVVAATAGRAMTPLTDNEIRDVLKSDQYGQRAVYMMNDAVTCEQFRDVMVGIARAVERRHGIGKETPHE